MESDAALDGDRGGIVATVRDPRNHALQIFYEARAPRRRRRKAHRAAPGGVTRPAPSQVEERSPRPAICGAERASREQLASQPTTHQDQRSDLRILRSPMSPLKVLRDNKKCSWRIGNFKMSAEAERGDPGVRGESQAGGQQRHRQPPPENRRRLRRRESKPFRTRAPAAGCDAKSASEKSPLRAIGRPRRSDFRAGTTPLERDEVAKGRNPAQRRPLDRATRPRGEQLWARRGERTAPGPVRNSVDRGRRKAGLRPSPASQPPVHSAPVSGKRLRAAAGHPTRRARRRETVRRGNCPTGPP
jgi:hypothetical protein